MSSKDNDEEDEIEVIKQERLERQARVTFQLHDSNRDGGVNTGWQLLSMMKMMGQPPIDNEEFEYWRKSFLEPNQDEIGVEEFISFYMKVYDSSQLSENAVHMAMKKITTDVKKGRGLYADPDRLREQLCKCCLTRPISRDLVVQLIREVDTNGDDHLEIQDFLIAMNVKDAA